jgi:hypothetical protein
MSHASADRSEIPGNRLAESQLPLAAGFRSVSGMSQVIFGRTPLWMSKDGSGPYAENKVGFVASLQQGFVLNSAIRRFGGLNAGLQLPLPMSFASAHPGPAEIFDYVWAFTNPTAPLKLLHNAMFMDAGAPGVTPMTSVSTASMQAWAISSAANGGMREFRLAWVRGDRLIEVNVVGSGLTFAAAQSVARSAGR